MEHAKTYLLGLLTAALIIAGYKIQKLEKHIEIIDREIEAQSEGSIVTIPDYMDGRGTTQQFITSRDLWTRIDKLAKNNNLKDDFSN